MRVKDIMTKNVASARPQDTVEKAARAMKDYDVGSVPVCEGKKVVGILTDRDIILRCVAQGKDPKQASVMEVMTPDPVTAGPDTDVGEAAEIMSARQVRRLPVVDDNDLVGIVALGDIAVEAKSTGSAGGALKDISEPSDSGGPVF